MQKRPAFVFAVTLLGLLGCYDFRSPLDAIPQLAVDPQLPGSWRCLLTQGGTRDVAATVVFTAAGEREYSIVFVDDDEGVTRFEAFPSSFSEETILNVRETSATSSDLWSLARYSLPLPDLLRVQLVDDDVLRPQQESPAGMRDALARHSDDPELYEEFLTCVRVPVPEPEPEPTPESEPEPGR